MSKERSAYKTVQNWLRQKGYYCEPDWQNIGGSKYRADVIGLKNVSIGYQKDDIEIVAMEVKRWLNTKCLAQAENYFDIANKVYAVQMQWADYISNKIYEGCLSRRIGLIVVKGNRCKELISAPFKHHREESQRIDFLNSIDICQCKVCGKYFHWNKETDWIKSTREFQAGKKFILWSAICNDCDKYVGNITKQLENRVGKLEEYCSWLEKKIMILKKNIRK